MLQSLKRAKLLMDKQSLSDPRVHSCVIRLQRYVTDHMSKFPDPIQNVLMNETKKADIFNHQTTKERNEEFMQKHSKQYQHLVAGKFILFEDRTIPKGLKTPS